MSIEMVMALFMLSLPVSIFIDYRLKLKADADPAVEYDLNSRLTDNIMPFAPFSVLFFTENFWFNLLYLIPLFIYTIVVMSVAEKKGWAPTGPAMIMAIFPGSVILTIVGYFIFFHEGVLSPELNPGTETVRTDKTNTGPLWPYWVYTGLLLSQLIAGLVERIKRTEAKASASLLFIQVAGFNILPLFTPHYWWSMLVGIIVFMVITIAVTNRMEMTTRGGMGFVLLYFYMMAAMASIILYAILF